MDAYLTAEALRAFEAFSILSVKPDFSGFLIGHKRGHRFIVENILPLPKGLRPSLENTFSLDRLLEGKIIGFFAFPPTAERRSSLFHPFACGKLFLGVRASTMRGLRFEPAVIDYEGRFLARPVELIIMHLAKGRS